MKLVELIYSKTEKFPFHEKFGLTTQIRKCAVSIPSNIAEGAGRNSPGQFLYFLEIAMGSCNELTTKIILSARLNFITSEEEEIATKECSEIYKMISVLHRNISDRQTSHHNGIPQSKY